MLEYIGLFILKSSSSLKGGIAISCPRARKSSIKLRIKKPYIILQPSRNGDITTIIKETVDKIIKGNAMIPFNFKPLDEFSGGMTRGEITVLGGRPGHGKTTLVVNLIRKLVEVEEIIRAL